MVQNDTTPGEGQRHGGSGPGALLRDERLRRDMTIDDVAHGLHLDRTTIQKLEQDDYEGLPPLTFVRGYLRSYCTLLGLDAQPVLERYSNVGLSEPESPLRPRAGSEAPRQRGRGPVLSAGPGLVGLALAIGVLLIAVAAGGWLLGNTSLQLPGSLGGDATVPAEADEADADADADADTDGNADANADSNADGDTNIDTEPDTATTGDAGNSATAPVVERPTAELPAAESSATESSAVEPPQVTDSVATPPVSQAESADGVAGTLRFVFNGESWMEVTDARGERLLFGLATPGEERLEGEPPFDIVIGDTRSVSLRYDGEAIDLEEYARGNVARFTLGGS